jgi:hypothetical protein
MRAFTRRDIIDADIVFWDAAYPPLAPPSTVQNVRVVKTP